MILVVVVVVVVVVGTSMADISQGTVAVKVSHLAIRVKTMVTLVEIKEIEVGVEADLTPAQMSEGLK